MKKYPKISIVTPSFNQGQYLEETILSVLNQNYPNFEYIIIDGGSTDNTVEIIKKYEDQLAYWVSEPDKGMYHAIQKGFYESSGEIMAWINSDDIYSKGAFDIVCQIFSDYQDIDWITGLTAHIDESSRIINCRTIRQWSKYSYALGDYQYIQQESTFWRRSLYEKAGGFISMDYSLAADTELWARFFNYAQLHSVNALLGLFRLRGKNQRSLENYQEYLIQCEDIIKNYMDKDAVNKICKLKKNSERKFFWRFFSEKYQQTLNYPSVIQFNRSTQKFQLSDNG